MRFSWKTLHLTVTARNALVGVLGLVIAYCAWQFPKSPKLPSSGSPDSEPRRSPVSTSKPENPRVRQAIGPGRDQPWKNSLGMEFVPVSGLSNILFCRTETRVRDFKAFSKATGYTTQPSAEYPISPDDASFRDNPRLHRDWTNPGFQQDDNHPVVYMNLQDAASFCDWLTEHELASGMLREGQRYRLPTDSEWSVAVGLDFENGKTPAEKDNRASEQYPWGHDFPPTATSGNYAVTKDIGHFKTVQGYYKEQDDLSMVWIEPTKRWIPELAPIESYTQTAPVARFAPCNDIFDLGGNVAEWCDTEFGFGSNFDAGSYDEYVLRGGSYLLSSERTLRSGFRGTASRAERRAYNGFRCVLDLQPLAH